MTGERRDAPALPDDPEDADPGLARERTQMAWLRSSLSFAAVGIAVLKIRPMIGVPILAFSGVAWSIGHVAGKLDEARAARRALAVTVAINLLAAASLVLTIVGSATRGIRL